MHVVWIEFRHDWWADIVCRHRRCFPRVNQVRFDAHSYPELDDHQISYLPAIVSRHEIVHLTVNDTLKLSQLRLILSHTSRLHTLEFDERISYYEELNPNERLLLIDLLDDGLTCSMLMSNGLRKLIFSIPSDMPDCMRIGQMIVERLQRLQLVNIYCCESDVARFLHLLINGLPNLIFLVADCGYMNSRLRQSQLRALQTPDTRPFRTELDPLRDGGFIYVWL
jgi:hypothetical protein